MQAAITKSPVVEYHMRDVDVTLLRENLKLTPEQRLRKLAKFAAFADELRKGGERARKRAKR